MKSLPDTVYGNQFKKSDRFSTIQKQEREKGERPQAEYVYDSEAMF